MGTRNLTMVISNSQTKVAQYGQFDGYPDGQGVTALIFLQKQLNILQFKEKVDQCRFITKEEIDNADKMSDTMFRATYPAINRSHGAEILSLIDNGAATILQDSSSFAAESLGCEWAYVIDLDKMSFEVYGGFNKSPLPDTDRFKPLEATLKPDCKYYPVKLVKQFDIKNLPSKADFIAAFASEEVED